MIRRGELFSLKRLFLSAVLAALAFVPSEAAAAVQGIGLSPTSRNFEVAPGDSISGEITVINDGDKDVVYKVYASDYRVENEDYTGVFTHDAAPSNISPVSWFSLPAGQFTARSRQQSTFKYTLKVPATATMGGHYGAVFIETVPPPATAGALVARVERIGSLMYIAVTGDLKKSGRVTGLTVPPVQLVSPVQAALRLKNDGNVHFLAEGSAQLASPFGDIGRPLPFKGEVLPGTTRRFDLKLPATTPIGLYRVTATVKYLDHTEIISHWTLLIPKVTLIIVSSSLALAALLLGIAIWRRTRRSKS